MPHDMLYVSGTQEEVIAKQASLIATYKNLLAVAERHTTERTTSESILWQKVPPPPPPAPLSHLSPAGTLMLA